MTSIGSVGMLGSGQMGSGVAALGDFVGLDTLARIGGIMVEEYREARYAAPPLLKRMVTAGRKGGRGFYDYSVEPPVPGDFR